MDDSVTAFTIHGPDGPVTIDANPAAMATTTATDDSAAIPLPNASDSVDVVAETGFRIGDTVTQGSRPNWIPDDASGSHHDVELPRWVAVSIDGVVVGYFDNEPSHGTVAGDSDTGAVYDLIYNEHLEVIGRFVNGIPGVTTKAP